MPTSKQLREERAALIAKARGIQNTADAENKRDLTAEENQEFDRLMAESDKLRGQIDQAERREKLEGDEAELRESQGRRSQPAGDRTRPKITAADRDRALRDWALYGTRHARHDADSIHRAAQCGIALASNELNIRALQVGTDSEGGYVTPLGFQAELIKKLAYYSPLRSVCRVLTTETGQDLEWPQVSDTANVAAIVAEEGAIGTTTDPAFGIVTFKAWKWASPIVKVSIELLQDSAVNIESLLADLFAERQGRGEEVQFFQGDGTTEPQGLIVGAADGPSLDSGNALTGDKIIDLFHSVDVAYRGNAMFSMHDTTAASVRKLKDGDGQYLWQPGLQAGQPDMLLGKPVLISNSFVATTASPGDDAALMLFGAIPSNYVIRDVGPSRVMVRLNELYAANGQVGFVMLQRTDGRYIGHSGCVKSLLSFDAP